MHIGVDLGNYYTKTSDELKFESRITEDSSVLTGQANVVEYNDKKYIIENGLFDISMNKIIKHDLMVNLATALAMNEDIDKDLSVRLAIGLPINHYHSQKEILKKIIMDNNQIKITYNGIKKSFLIDECEVLPESVGVYYSLSKDMIKSLEGRDVMIIDIGGKTTDTCIIDSRKSIQRPSTQPFGMLGLYNDICNAINASYPEACVKVEDVMDIINNGLYIFDKKIDINFIDTYINNFVKNIYNFIKLQYEDYQRKVIILAGGGGIFIGERLKQYIPNVIVNKDIFANAKGFKKYLDIYGGNK